MKKFWLSLGLTLMLVCWCGEGYYGFGTGAAFGQQTYYAPSLSCNPSDPSCYKEYHSAPYADPLSQLLYYIAPPVQDQRYEARQRYQYQETKKERRDRERRERQERRERARQGY